MTDRVLTIWQPWAGLIMDGTKPVENRSWKTFYRGRLWIHAGLTIDRNAMWTVGRPGADEPRGVILGHVELVDVVRDSDSPWAEPGQFHWLLENPTPVKQIPYRGGQGLRHFTPS